MKFLMTVATVAAGVLVGCQQGGLLGGKAAGNGPAAGKLTVTGKVMDAATQPVAGATVSAYVAPAGNVPAAVSKLVAKAVTGTDGGFVIVVPDNVEKAPVTLIVNKSGKAMGWASIRSGKPQPLTIRLGAPAGLSGQVVDEKGNGLAKATVRLFLLEGRGRRDTRWVFTHGIPGLETTTDAKGQFGFADLAAGESFAFEAELAGKANVATLGRRTTLLAAGATGVKITMPEEAVIELSAIDKATSRPVKGLTLLANNRRVMAAPMAEPVKGQPGRYRFSKLPSGDYQIRLARPSAGTMADYVISSPSIELRAGQKVSDLKLELNRGGIAELAVLDAETLKPIAAAGIEMWGRGPEDAATDAQGIARIRAVPGDYRVGWVNAEGYGHGSGAAVKIEQDKTTRVQIKLTHVPVVSGTVRLSDGKALAEAGVFLLPEDRGYFRGNGGGGGGVQSGPDGAFSLQREFDRWPSVSKFVLIARHAGGNLAGLEEIKPGKQALDLKVQPGLTIAGKVVDRSGKPIANASVRPQFGRDDPMSLPQSIRASTDAQGGYRIPALPAGRDYSLLISARNYGAVDVLVEAASAKAGTAEAPTATLAPAHYDAPAPAVKILDIPAIPGEWAVWGATGSDKRGAIWFSVTAHDVKQPSAHLFEYDPKAGKVADRGDIVQQLAKAGLLRQNEAQMKIHTKIVQAGDGKLYFSSMDEEGEDEAKQVLPTWGGHVWRMDPATYAWEHLLAVPEALIALAGQKRFVYTMGYWDHTLYQLDTQTLKSRSVKVGACAAHVSRNILADANEHVYVPRVAQGPMRPTAALVELDADLKEVGSTPLRYYFEDTPSRTHGITGLVYLTDGSIVFNTHNGYLSRIQPSKPGPAKVTDIGFLHPSGPTYCASLFADQSGRYVMGAISARDGYEWVVRDVQSGESWVSPLAVTEPESFGLNNALLYGNQTRDAQGGCYVAGLGPRGRAGHGPIVLRVQPAPLP